MAEKRFAIGQGFVSAVDIGMVEDHARGAGIDQIPNPVDPAGVNHIGGAADVDRLIFLPRSPDPRLGGNMENRIVPLKNTIQKGLILNIATEYGNP
jgi:hypothetical protein